MFIRQTKETTTELDKAINLALIQLQTHKSDSPEFAKIVDQLEKLHKMQPAKRDPYVKFDSLVSVGGNLLGILAILVFESENVITTKALGFVLKSRV